MDIYGRWEEESFGHTYWFEFDKNGEYTTNSEPGHVFYKNEYMLDGAKLTLVNEDEANVYMVTDYVLMGSKKNMTLESTGRMFVWRQK